MILTVSPSPCRRALFVLQVDFSSVRHLSGTTDSFYFFKRSQLLNLKLQRSPTLVVSPRRSSPTALIHVSSRREHIRFATRSIPSTPRTSAKREPKPPFRSDLFRHSIFVPLPVFFRSFPAEATIFCPSLARPERGAFFGFFF